MIGVGTIIGIVSGNELEVKNGFEIGNSSGTGTAICIDSDIDRYKKKKEFIFIIGVGPPFPRQLRAALGVRSLSDSRRRHCDRRPRRFASVAESARLLY
ncbi:hypothetical protein EVAR_78945_1 [Eumeta japonica]|uniref:Uncharacterized protein n=1 Tax=Eumeta variegata TaxID=151549 RepID=A0A4C1U415_EUMVA|nr:hypothetical protein EVAR_78945_1 [Eumeta japonica]